MKKLLIIALLIIPIFGFAQKDTIGLNLPMKEGKIVFENVIEIPNKSKMDLYNNAKQWFVDYFRSSKDVIQNEDKDQGRIIGKGIIFIKLKALVTQTYDDKITIQIDCKDGKYRYRIYDMIGTVPAQYNSLVGHISASDFTGEELIGKLTGTGKAQFTKNQCRKLLESINNETHSTIASLQKAMNEKTDSF